MTDFEENLARVIQQRDTARDLAARYESEIALAQPLIKAAIRWTSKETQREWAELDRELTDAVDDYLDGIDEL